MVRYIWNICNHDPSSNWALWARANLLRGRSFWDIPIPRICSWTWRKILRMRNEVRPYFRTSIGNGHSTFLWFDYWLPIGPIHPLLGNGMILDAGLGRNEKVSTIINNGEWQWPDSHSLDINFLKSSIPIGMVPQPNQEDTIVWGPMGEAFSISSAWKALRVHKPKVIWHKVVWFHGNIPRTSFILWLAIRERLGTQDKLFNTPPLAECLLCGLAPEDHSHLFFSCPISKYIWRRVLWKFGSSAPPLTWSLLIQWIAGNWTGGSLITIVKRLCLATSVYYIWAERNRRFHSNSRSSTTNLIAHIVETVRGRLNTFTRVKDTQENRWLQAAWNLDDSIFSIS